MSEVRSRLNGDMTETTDVPAAARESVAALTSYTDLDWQQLPAAGLQWSCRQTTLHMLDCLYFYAMQVIYGDPGTYLCTELALDDSASPPRLLAALTAHAELLDRGPRPARTSQLWCLRPGRVRRDGRRGDADPHLRCGARAEPRRPVATAGCTRRAGARPAVPARSQRRPHRRAAVLLRPRGPGRIAAADRMAVGWHGQNLVPRQAQPALDARECDLMC